jgi:hypothetical protein
MRRIIMFLSFALVIGSVAAASRWPAGGSPVAVPHLDAHPTSTAVPSATVDAGYKRVPVAPVYTLPPRPSASPQPSPSPSDTPVVTPTPSPTASPINRCGGCSPRPGLKCPALMCAYE